MPSPTTILASLAATSETEHLLERGYYMSARIKLPGPLAYSSIIHMPLNMWVVQVNSDGNFHTC
jgi:hypothetical protein